MPRVHAISEPYTARAARDAIGFLARASAPCDLRACLAWGRLRADRMEREGPPLRLLTTLGLLAAAAGTAKTDPLRPRPWPRSTPPLRGRWPTRPRPASRSASGSPAVATMSPQGAPPTSKPGCSARPTSLPHWQRDEADVIGRPTAEVLEDQVFGPLGMGQSPLPRGKCAAGAAARIWLDRAAAGP